MPAGGKRPGGVGQTGPRGPYAPTLSKEAAREALRTLVLREMERLVRAQLDNATGISHFMLRDPETGQFQRLTDVDQIQAALNAEGASEGSTYYIYTKDPVIQAFTDLMNRALDKPKEQEQEIKMTGDAAFLELIRAGRQRVAEAKKGR